MIDKIKNWKIYDIVKKVIEAQGVRIFPKDRDHLLELALGGKNNEIFEIFFDVPNKGKVKEGWVVKCKNGIAVNYTEVYMRRRDPDCLYIGDNKETDKPRFKDVFKKDFSILREETFNWLASQDLIVMPFTVGRDKIKYDALFIGPTNCGFFAGAIADLQRMIKPEDVPDDFAPKITLYLAPYFRHTEFNGKQIVVHNRTDGCYEIFSYNLYPGPSAKKGLYGALLQYGEEENWLTLHSSSTKVVTPYKNEVIMLHEGASGGGKSELNEYMEHSENNRMIIGENIVTGDIIDYHIIKECELFPISDDMTLTHPSISKNNGKITILDAEHAWFVRVDHIKKYGVNPNFERLCIHPKIPILFLNIDCRPGATCLIWEHIMDDNGKPCPNPRVIFPRELVPGVVNEPVEVDYRSFGVRTPPCRKEKPTYGIIGYFHILPRALAWLWRLTAPRGYDNPSIVDTIGMTSEGVGSYGGPFLPGSFIKHANLLLDQIIENPKTIYILFPNQYVGAWKVKFMPQWLIREYLARRGNKPYDLSLLRPAKCELLGYIEKKVIIEEFELPEFLLDVRLQPEVGEEAYLKGADIFYDFFRKELENFDKPNLSEIGKKIIQCFKDRGSVADYENLIK